jgi:hypothetical protein
LKGQSAAVGEILASKMVGLTDQLEVLTPRRRGQFLASIDPASVDAVIVAEKKLLFGDVETGSSR